MVRPRPCLQRLLWYPELLWRFVLQPGPDLHLVRALVRCSGHELLRALVLRPGHELLRAELLRPALPSPLQALLPQAVALLQAGVLRPGLLRIELRAELLWCPCPQLRLRRVNRICSAWASLARP